MGKGKIVEYVHHGNVVKLSREDDVQVLKAVQLVKRLGPEILNGMPLILAPDGKIIIAGV